MSDFVQPLSAGLVNPPAPRRWRRQVVLCTVCGRSTEGTARRRYCQAACKLRAQRQRRRALIGSAADLD